MIADFLPPWALLAVFVGAAAATWIAGVELSKYTDVLAMRFKLGEALGGLILLAVATNLPELAITVSAAASGDLSIAVGNILGGIALQTVVLVLLDLFGVRGVRSLTYRAASLSLIVEAALVIAMLAVVIGGSQLPADLIALRLTPDVVLIVGLWVIGILLVTRASRSMAWQDGGRAPGSQPEPQGHSSRRMAHVLHERMGTGKSVAIFGAAAIVTLIAGVLLEQSGSALADHAGVSGVVFGATFLAAATALPELSTGLTAVKQHDYRLAVSDIFGGNAFLPVLFAVATLISGKAVLPNAQASDIYLTALAILLTLVYLLGLAFRPERKVIGMGVDSLVVLVLYVIGIGGLFAIASISTT